MSKVKIPEIKNKVSAFRLVAGIAALLAGAWLAWFSSAPDSLALAVGLLGAFILGHLALESYFQSIRGDHEPLADSGWRDFALSFVSTSGVILGLLAVFDKTHFTTTIKVGIGALVTDILLGIVLIGLLLAGAAPTAKKAWNLIRVVFNIALWALSLGLLCISIALLSR